MKVVLSEKPSVAREIAAFLGARSRREGYFEGSGYQVTWALGHLVTLKEPDEYDPALKKWSLDPLPFVPDRFELKLVSGKESKKQFSIVKKLFRGAAELICATDAGREGELIFRYILTLTGCTRKPFRRLWLSSLTESAIRNAFRNLRPGSEYDNLYAAAKCRSEADWIVGMNGTRYYTVRYRDAGILWSVGRVQTPILAMIVRRDDEIRTFKPEPFWELMTRYRDTTFKYAGDRFQKEEDAKSLLARVEGQVFVVAKVERNEQRSQPPQLYDLTELQRDMNRRYGFSAADTLRAAQSLYEKKLITYPRTDSRYLTSDIKKEVPGILRKLATVKQNEIDKLDLQSLRFTGRIVNDKKVGAHHAIIPTGSVPGQLASRDAKIYDAILTRLIAVLYPPCVKEITTVHGTSNGVRFRAKGIRIVDPGWTALYPRKSADDKDEDQQELPAFTPGESGSHKPFVKRGETSPPRPFTENTLLGAMETAGKLVDDEQLREALKEKGLGTPATRAAIIETLLKRSYVNRTKKTLTATDFGRYLIALVRDGNLKSPELTGQWESKLREIEAGRLDSQRFVQEIVAYANQIVGSAHAPTVDSSTFGDCPRCGRPVIQGKRGFGCSGWRDGCSFVLWPTYKDHEFSIEEIRTLVQHRALLEPRESAESGKVILSLTDSGHITEIPIPSEGQRSAGGRRKGKPWKGKRRAAGTSGKSDREASSALGPCPLCGADVVEQKKSFSCSAWKKGCQFVIWKTMAGKRISSRTAKTLMQKGETSLLRGFKSKAGKAFDARLKLADGKVTFEFD